MSEEQKDRLRELIQDLVIANRDEIFEQGRWDSSRRARDLAAQEITNCEEAIETFLVGA